MSRHRALGAVAVWPSSAYAVRYLVGSLTAPASAFHVHCVFPEWPRFVVMTMTPFAASVPYSVAADGPFTISISSISCGSRFVRLLVAALVDPLPIGFA